MSISTKQSSGQFLFSLPSHTPSPQVSSSSTLHDEVIIVIISNVIIRNKIAQAYNIFGKFATIAGPFLMGIVARLTGHSKYGILAIFILFLIGGILLSKVKEENLEGEILDVEKKVSDN